MRTLLPLIVACALQAEETTMAQGFDRITGKPFASRSEVIAPHAMAATSQPLATQVALDTLKAGGIRGDVDTRPEKMQKKIRDAEVEKIPIMAVVGAKEASSDSVSVRSKAEGSLGTMKIEEFVNMLKERTESRK